jgi:hypothetical protein
MGMVAPFQRIATAFYVFFGKRGDISRQAERWGVCRQAVYRQAQQVLSAVEGTEVQAEIANLRRQVEELQRQNNEWRAERDKREPLTVTIDADKQAEFASVAQANGVSLPVTRCLLEVLLRKETPSVAKLGRITLAAGQKAKETLAVLDEVSRPLARQGVLDEIFTGKQPVLMAVEPDSLCWLNGRLAPSREGDEWVKDLRQLPALEQATSDLGSGLLNGLKKLNEERAKAGAAEVAIQGDHFHLSHEFRRALRRQQNRASQTLKKAEAAEKKLEDVRRHGQNAAGYASAASSCWRKAEQAMDRWIACERVWQRLREGLKLFTPTGELNSRARVEALIAEILPQLEGKEWARVQRWLKRRSICTFLDRVEKQLAELPIEPEVRQTLVEAEGISRRSDLTAGESRQAAAQRGVVLMAEVLVGILGQAGALAQEKVRGVLRHTWRASSLVEGLNSVLRMQQARHRKLSQEMLDLKRLYWNCRTLRTGRRRKQTPYQRLGLKLPELRWWELLKLSPEQLRSQLSAVPIAA